MERIAIVDDRPGQRESVARLISAEIEDAGVELEVLEADPLPSIEDYVSWIHENDICLLILDELLGEEARVGMPAVEYSGHDVVSHVRQRLPDLPQFVVATSIQSAGLRRVESEVEDTIERRVFINRSTTYIPRMLRMAKRYLDRNQQELAELATISAKLVDGDISEEDRERLDAIRAKTNVAYSADEVGNMRDAIADMELVRDQLKRLVIALEKDSRD